MGMWVRGQYRAAAAQIARCDIRARLWAMRRHSGQGLVEYALLLLMIAIVVIGLVTVLGQTVSGTWYNKIIQRMPS